MRDGVNAVPPFSMREAQFMTAGQFMRACTQFTTAKPSIHSSFSPAPRRGISPPFSMREAQFMTAGQFMRACTQFTTAKPSIHSSFSPAPRRGISPPFSMREAQFMTAGQFMRACTQFTTAKPSIHSSFSPAPPQGHIRAISRAPAAHLSNAAPCSYSICLLHKRERRTKTGSLRPVGRCCRRRRRTWCRSSSGPSA